jgi:hypothetical protein
MRHLATGFCGKCAKRPIGLDEPMFRRLRVFVRTFRKARALGFTLVDAIRAANVNSRAA